MTAYSRFFCGGAVALGAIALLSGQATAASRTVQFAGVTTTFGDHNLPILPLNIGCTVLIANTGTTNQAVSRIAFNVFTPTIGLLETYSSSGSGTSQLTLEEIYNAGTSGATSFTPTCSTSSNATSPQSYCTDSAATPTTHVITPGGFFIATVQTQQVTQSSFSIVPCSGTVTVTDATASPGSVVATGAISFFGEQVITGGQFQGAIYVSGSHSPANGTASAYQAFGSAALPALARGTYNMNLYCSAACETALGNTANSPQACAVMCGGGDSDLGSNRDLWMTSHSTRNVGGYLEEYKSPSTASNVITGVTGASGSPFHLNTVNEDNFRGMIRHANPHYAGGQVVEMIMGPFESICSGNQGYFEAGGQDFDHRDSYIGTDSDFKLGLPSNTAKGPPERLYCSHIHRKDPPFGYAAHSSPFTIQGGNAF